MSNIQRVFLAIVLVLLVFCAGFIGYWIGSTNLANAIALNEYQQGTTVEATQTGETAVATVSGETVSADIPEAVTVTPDAATTTETAPEDLSAGSLGDYNVSILRYDLIEDYEGSPAIRVYFEFTNNSSENASFLFAIDAVAFQNGIELETAIVTDRVDEDDNNMKEIKPGTTITCTEIYVLDDQSPVEVEVSELISFSDEMLTETFEIAN